MQRSRGITVNCELFAKILADFQEGKLRFGEQSAAEAHLKGCDSCRRLLAIARGKLSVLPEEISRELALSIIEHTSGPACPRVEECLCSYVDGELSSEVSQLVSSHLDSCPACRTLADRLGIMAEELPQMAEIEPEAEFTQKVLGATSRWRPFRPSLRTRFLTWWNRVIQRPRFSYEAAYVGTLVLVFAFGNPVPPLRSITLEIVDPSSFQPAIRERVSKILPTGWVDAEAPMLRLARTYAVTASERERAASKAMRSMTRRCEQIFCSALEAQAKSLNTWKQEVTGAFRSLRSNLSARISRVKS
jgi:hypothetical protein